MRDRSAKALEDLKVGSTYRCYNHSIAFGEEWITPTAIDLKKRKLTFENAARKVKEVTFTDPFHERDWFNFNNIYRT